MVDGKDPVICVSMGVDCESTNGEKVFTDIGRRVGFTCWEWDGVACFTFWEWEVEGDKISEDVSSDVIWVNQSIVLESCHIWLLAMDKWRFLVQVVA